MPQRSRRLLRDVDPIVAAVLDGQHDAILDSIEQAVRHRRKAAAPRIGTRVRLVGTRNPRLEGKEGEVVKVNAKRLSIFLDGDAFDTPLSRMPLAEKQALASVLAPLTMVEVI
jgi:chaperone required for assembly of F1-ATPase